ncbi:MAG: hypothetical protein ABR503_08965, partial [Chitinophagaceae bacterium]
MKNLLLFFIGLSIVNCHATNVFKVPGNPVVFALNMQALQKNKARILAKDKLIMPAYKLLLKDADKALSFGPVSV